MLGIADPAGTALVPGQLPLLEFGVGVKLRAGIRHCRIKIGPLSVEMKRQVKRRSHALISVIRKTKDVICSDRKTLRLYATNRIDNLLITEPSLIHPIAYMFGRRLDTDSEPPEPGSSHLHQHRIVVHGIDTSVSPDVEVVTALDDLVADVVDVLLVEYEHLVGKFD